MIHLNPIAFEIPWNHLHPVLVHFTTALLPVSFFSDAVGKYLSRKQLNEAGFWSMLYAAIATPLTAVAGWMWTDVINTASGGKIPLTLDTHQFLGFALTVCYLVLAAWRIRAYLASAKPSLTYLVATASVMMALFYQGYLGGMLTMG
jgi:uncharacterized membrane protein